MDDEALACGMPCEINSDIRIEMVAYRKGRHANRLRLAAWVLGDIHDDFFQLLDQVRVPVGLLTNGRTERHARFTIPLVPPCSMLHLVGSWESNVKGALKVTPLHLLDPPSIPLIGLHPNSARIRRPPQGE